MITCKITRNAPDANGNTATSDIVIDCKTMKDALHEYARITAAIRDMVIKNAPEPITEDVANATVFSAFKTGMEKVPYSKEAADRIKR